MLKNWMFSTCHVLPQIQLLGPTNTSQLCHHSSTVLIDRRSKLSQLRASNAGAEDVFCANCMVIRFNKEGVFLIIKPKGLGSSKGLKGIEEGKTNTDGIIDGSIRLFIFFFFLVSGGCESGKEESYIL
jgi:hypothetical protein